MQIHTVDLLILVAYFGVIVALGFWFSRKNTSTDNYFLGGRSMPGWLLGVSLISSIMSSMTFIAGPADSFKTAWFRTVQHLAVPLGGMLAAWVFVPFFRRGTISSAYEYLNKRFGASISVYAAGAFMVMQIMRASMIMYLLAIILQSMTGVRYEWCLIIGVAVSGIYTVKGGLRAVVYLDVVQTGLLLLGAFLLLGIIFAGVKGGIPGVFGEAWAANKLSFWDIDNQTGRFGPTSWRWSFSEKTVTTFFFVGILSFLIGCLDQINVQRWCAAKSAREARKSILVLGFGALPVWFAFKFIGTALFVYFSHNPDPVASAILAGDGAYKAEMIVPHFIVTYLPVGIAGLVIAGAMAAAMGSLSACISSSGMVWVGDIYKKYIKKTGDDRHYLLVGKLASGAVTMCILVSAMLVHTANTSTLADLHTSAVAVLGGSVPGLFFLGMFTRRGNKYGAWAGIAAAMCYTLYMLLGQVGALPAGWRLPIHIYYLAFFGNMIVLGAGYLVSRLTRRRTADLKNLTVWDQEKTPLV
jgi:SSS family solute:Na+ symporter